jgi:hypothetical protein
MRQLYTKDWSTVAAASEPHISQGIELSTERYRSKLFVIGGMTSEDVEH